MNKNMLTMPLDLYLATCERVAGWVAAIGRHLPHYEAGHWVPLEDMERGMDD